MADSASTEADLVRRIEALRVKQERAENDEVEAILGGANERQLAGIRRRANQALWNRRKLQKELNELRATLAQPIGGDRA